MKIKINLFSLLFTLVAGLLLFATGSAVYGAEGGAAIVGTVAVLGLVTRKNIPAGALRNDLYRTVFENRLMRQTFPDNSFYNGALVDTAALDAERVVIPQEAQGLPTVVEGPTNFPMQMEERENTTKDYSAVVFATKPERVSFVDQRGNPINLLTTKAENHALVLNTRVADMINREWCPTNSSLIIRSNGTARTGSQKGATGNRAGFATGDIIRAMTLHKEQDLDMIGAMRILVSHRGYEDVLKNPDFVAYDKRGVSNIMGDGLVGTLLGYEVYRRSYTWGYKADGTPYGKNEAVDPAEACGAMLFMCMPYLRYAKSEVKGYMTPFDDGTLLGRTVNGHIVSGATHNYTDQRGIIALVEDN